MGVGIISRMHFKCRETSSGRVIVSHTRRAGPPATLLLACTPYLLFVGLPIAALLFAFKGSVLIGQWQSGALWPAFALTMITTMISTMLVIAFGTPVAYLLSRGESPLHAVIDTLVDLPIALPPVVVGVALLLAFGRYGLIGRHLHVLGVNLAFTPAAVVLAQFVVASPYFVRTLRAGFASIDRRLEDVAFSHGADRMTTFLRVTLPLSSSSLIAGCVLTWARALSEFGATMMFAGNLPGKTQTLSLAVMSAMDVSLDSATSISIVSLVLAALALVAVRMLPKLNETFISQRAKKF